MTRPCAATGSLLVLLLALLSACDRPEPSPVGRRNGSAGDQSQRDHFAIATEYLDRFQEHMPAHGQKNTLYHLNQWLSEQPPAEAWKVDPLAKQLPLELREYDFAQQYDRPTLDELDGRSLWEAAMLRRISSWALDYAHDDPLLADWYLAMEGTHGADYVHRLKTAAALFDWTVRNIQLDPLLPRFQPPSDAEPLEQPAPALGIPGPGYRFEPWQVALFGRGDAWQRARLFIRLARQQQLEVVMLAVDDSATNAGPQPWLPALLLEEQLYLFDTRLGTPLPGPDFTGIATLAEARGQPEVLLQCNVQDASYPVKAAQLKGVDVWIDATPTELSQRAERVEGNFIGKQKLRLTVSPSDIAQRLQAVDGISGVRVWPIGAEAILYRANAAAVVTRNRDLYREYVVREVLFETANPISRARWQHLAGNFDSTTVVPGAKAYYLEARNAEERLALLAQSPQVQRQLGMRDMLETQPEMREQILQRSEVMLRQAAQNASYWLATINYEEGKFDVALNWLERHTLGTGKSTVWATGANYNVGRCYEQLSELEKALAHYRTLDASPALPGELLRAKWFEARFSQ